MKYEKEFKVICDETNNSKKDAEEGVVRVDVELRPAAMFRNVMKKVFGKEN